jgi:hypothetical protein
MTFKVKRTLCCIKLKTLSVYRNTAKAIKLFSPANAFIVLEPPAVDRSTICEAEKAKSEGAVSARDLLIR